MSHGITVTASAMLQSANGSNMRWEFTYTTGVTNAVEYNWKTQFWSLIDTVDTAKKLCKTRTFISTSYKWFTKELHWNSYTFTCTVLTDSLN